MKDSTIVMFEIARILVVVYDLIAKYGRVMKFAMIYL